MKYSVSEVLQYVREEDVKFIRLAFCDIYGRQKNLAIMPYELEHAFQFGMPIDATAITGFDADGSTDLFLIPDPATLTQLPWRPESGRVVRMFCSIVHADGSPYEADCRALLQRSLKKADDAGIHFEFGTSMEFYLFVNDENGLPTRIPYDNAGYMDIAPADKGENVRREIQLTLERMGIQPVSSHHEEGPGQNEIDFKHTEPLLAADHAITYVSVVKTVASRYGLTADFSPKPVLGLPGSGLHIMISASSADGRDVLDSCIGGIMEKICDMTVFLDPTENSYERLGRNKAPRHVTWSRGDRSHLIRIPDFPGKEQYAELRSPDPISNPYLALTLLVSAGLYGIEHNLPLPECSDLDLYQASEDVTEHLEKLPASLHQAQKLAGRSEFIRSLFPESIINAYCSKN